MKKIKDLKLEEKLPFLSGVDCWSLPKFDGKTTLRMSDGPHGLRYVYKEENFNQISKKNRAYPSLSSCRRFLSVLPHPLLPYWQSSGYVHTEDFPDGFPHYIHFPDDTSEHQTEGHPQRLQ